MWQIYSEKKNGVRIRTTVGRLIDSVCAIHGSWADAICFIGKVNYLSEAELKALGRTMFMGGIISAAVANSLLVKRKAYKYEDEVRLICIENEMKIHAGGVYKYKVNPHALFDQAMVAYPTRSTSHSRKKWRNAPVRRTSRSSGPCSMGNQEVSWSRFRGLRGTKALT